MWFLFYKLAKRRYAHSTNDSLHGRKRHLIYSIWRFLQFIAGFVVLGLYLTSKDSDKDRYNPIIFSIAVSGASSVLSFLLSFDLPAADAMLAVGFDWLISICYIVMVGIWAPSYLAKTDPGVIADVKDQDVRLHHAVYVNLAGMALWILAAIYTSAKFWAKKKSKSKNGPSEIPVPVEMGNSPYQPM